VTAAAVLALALAAGETFEAAFPGSVVHRSDGGQIVQATGFTAPSSRAASRVESALGLLRAHPEDFSIGSRQRLSGTQEGRRVRVVRTVDGRPVFEGDVVVGFDARGSIFIVNASPVAAEPSGRATLPLRAALEAASAAVGKGSVSGRRAKRGWYSVGNALRPAWRIDVTTQAPSGETRVYVDAASGAILMKASLRAQR
jgi:Zn-dependent metalloprotease